MASMPSSERCVPVSSDTASATEPMTALSPQAASTCKTREEALATPKRSTTS